jgi:2-hydroxy-3-keto-5-methylthiopentenyl-1-phosphate phosphatase
LSSQFSPNRQERIVFCDFDGTITAVETFAGMLKEFSPELSAQLMPQMYERQLTLREGVRQILESIPSSRYPDIIESVRTKPIRPGLEALLDFLDTQSVPMVVISGGLRGMVETVLSRTDSQGRPLLERVAGVYAVDVDTSGEYLRAVSEFEGETELVAKVQVMAQHPAEEPVAIGDSLTDLNMALQVPLVFARDRLSDYLDEHDQPYLPWNDFFDVRDRLAERWE